MPLINFIFSDSKSSSNFHRKGASRCTWLFAFLDAEGNILDELESPAFLLNCNRTQQRYTNAMLSAEHFLDAGCPAQQTYLSREG